MTMTATATGRDEIKASRQLIGRVWREFDEFVEGRAGRWAGIAEAVLNSEGGRAADGYAEAGEAAAIAAVEDREWSRYIERVWLSTVPDGAALIMPFLSEPKAARITDPALRAAVEWIRANGAREAAVISNASRKGIANQIRIGVSKGESEQQIAERIRKHYRSVRQGRAETIARTEIHAAANYGSLSAASESEIALAKIWVDTPDDRTRDAHIGAGGQRKPLGSPFLVGGERMMYPGDSSMGASAENLVNCRCTLFYVRARRPATPPRRRRRPAVAA